MEQVEDLRNKRADRQALSVLDAFNKDRASMPQPLQGPPTLAPLPLAPDARTQEMIKEKLKRAEELGEEGRVDEAQKLMNEADALKKLVRAEPITDPAKQAALDVRITDQKLRVCDICGAFLSVYDSDRRLADHFGGKLHLGYIQIREKLEDLKAAQEELRKSRKSERADDDRHVRGTSRDRDRHEGDKDRRSDYDRERRERSRDRTHDRYSRERDRGSVDRDRDYDRRRRDREGVRSHSRSRSRSRERGSGRYRERESSDYHRDSYSRYDRR
ncbi:hypothetical protein KP509_21G019300 [Ceratopteris richardii]|nr:hypothetical protein KP509_21G019300 [Ceratopteris richardii]